MCSICLKPKEYKLLNCGHSFHTKCIDNWAITCAKNLTDNTCPLCRQKFMFDSPSYISWTSEKINSIHKYKTRHEQVKVWIEVIEVIINCSEKYHNAPKELYDVLIIQLQVNMDFELNLNLFNYIIETMRGTSYVSYNWYTNTIKKLKKIKNSV